MCNYLSALRVVRLRRGLLVLTIAALATLSMAAFRPADSLSISPDSVSFDSTSTSADETPEPGVTPQATVEETTEDAAGALQLVFIGEEIPSSLRAVDGLVDYALYDVGSGYSGLFADFSYVARYADWIGNATGLPVKVVNLTGREAVGTADLLAQIQSDTDTRDAIANADIVVVGPPSGDLPWNSESDPCDGSETAYSPYTEECVDKIVTTISPIMEVLYAEIVALREDESTALRTLNLYNHVFSQAGAASGEAGAAVKMVLDAWNGALQDAAETNGFVVGDVYQRFNGADGRESPGDLLRNARTLSEKGVESIASVLIDTRYRELLDAGVREHPFAGQDRWLAAVFDWYGAPRSNGDWWAEMWLMRPDGTGAHPIAADLPHPVYKFDWSPDGTKIIIGTNGAIPRLYEYTIATGELSQAIDCSTPCIEDWEANYSPEGDKIVFVRAYDRYVPAPHYFFGELPQRCAIAVADLASGEITEILHPKIEDTDFCELPWEPKWSPDGTQILYWLSPSSAKGERLGSVVHVVNADGTNDRAITDPALSAGEASWSPDGEWIVFSTNTMDEYAMDPVVSNLYRIRPDGTGLEQLTHYETTEIRAVTPTYSPDGEWIFFTGQMRPGKRLWAMPAEGGDPVFIRRGSNLDWLRPKLQPEMAAITPPEHLNMVIIGNALGDFGVTNCEALICAGFAEQYANSLNLATGIPISVTNLSLKDGESVEELVERVKEDESVRDALAAAEIIIVSIAHDDVAWLRKGDACGDDARRRDWTLYTEECASADADALRPAFEEAFSTIAALRAGEPTILRAFNRYNEWVDAPIGGAEVPELSVQAASAIELYLAHWNPMVCEAAESAGFVCTDLHRQFNGEDGTGTISHLLTAVFRNPSSPAIKLIASALIDQGYPELEELGLPEHPLAHEAGTIALEIRFDRVPMDGSYNQIWLMNPDGTGAHPVAPGVAIEAHRPSWSPDGAHIVFGDLLSPRQLNEVDLSTGETQVMMECDDLCVGDWEGAYSPEGDRVAFVRELGPLVYSPVEEEDVPSTCGIFILEIEIGETAQLSPEQDCVVMWEPRWSPDGEEIVYWISTRVADARTGTAIRILDQNGNERTLVDETLFPGNPDWSPDGEWILFATYPESEFEYSYVSNLYRVHPDGSGLEQLTFYEDASLRPAVPRYSADGKWILFTTKAHPYLATVMAMPADGGEAIPLLKGVLDEWYQGEWGP